MFVMSTGGLLMAIAPRRTDIAQFPSLMYGFIMQQNYRCTLDTYWMMDYMTAPYILQKLHNTAGP